MGLSVGPRVGPDYLLIGDAGGSINPFNGEGIAYGYETGRLAASVIGRRTRRLDLALLATRATPRGRLRRLLPGRLGLYAADDAAPRCWRLLAGGMHSATFMSFVLRIMSNMLARGLAPPELAYRAIAGAMRLARDFVAAPQAPASSAPPAETGLGHRGGDLLGGGERLLELHLAVREGGEDHLVGARCKGDPPLEHPLKKAS